MRSCAMLLIFPVVACASPGGPAGTRSEPQIRELPSGWVLERRIATIDHFGNPVFTVSIQVPESVARGQEFVVKVTTYGSDCVGKGDTEARVNGLSAVVTPYDWEVTRLPPKTGCSIAIRPHEHTASLRFDQAGSGRLVIRGRRKPSGNVITVERRIEVR
jgi:hypothetical protein